MGSSAVRYPIVNIKNPLMQFQLRSMRLDRYSLAGGGPRKSYYVYPLYSLRSHLKAMTCGLFEEQNPVYWLFTHSLLVDAQKGIFSVDHSLIASKGAGGGDAFLTCSFPEIVDNVCSIEWENPSLFGYTFVGNDADDCFGEGDIVSVNPNAKISIGQLSNVWGWAIHFVALVFSNRFISNEVFCKALIQLDNHGKSALYHARTYLDFLYIDKTKKTPDLRVMSLLLFKIEDILNDNTVPADDKLTMVSMVAISAPGCDSILMKMLKNDWARSKIAFIIDPLLEVLGSRKYSNNLFECGRNNWLAAVCHCIVVTGSAAAIDQLEAAFAIYKMIDVSGELFKRHVFDAVVTAIKPCANSASVVEKLLSYFGYQNSCELLFVSSGGAALKPQIAKAQRKIENPDCRLSFENILFPYRLSTIFQFLKKYAQTLDVKGNGGFRSYLSLSRKNQHSYNERKDNFINHISLWINNDVCSKAGDILDGYISHKYSELIGSCQLSSVANDLLADRNQHIFQGLYDLAISGKGGENSLLVIDLCNGLTSFLLAKIPSLADSATALAQSDARAASTTQFVYSFEVEHVVSDQEFPHRCGKI
jgi:hypothetical protein